MLQVNKIARTLFPEGRWSGMPCVLVSVSSKGEERDLDSIVQEVLSHDIKHVLVKGILSANPDIRDLLVGLNSKGKVVTFVTDASDTIEVVRLLHNFRFFLGATPPTEEKNDIPSNLFGLLKEEDEIKFNIKSLDEYQRVVEYMKDKTVTRPTVLFSISNNADNPVEIADQYLADCKRFIFKSRMTKKMVL